MRKNSAAVQNEITGINDQIFSDALNKYDRNRATEPKRKTLNKQQYAKAHQNHHNHHHLYFYENIAFVFPENHAAKGEITVAELNNTGKCFY